MIMELGFFFLLRTLKVITHKEEFITFEIYYFIIIYIIYKKLIFYNNCILCFLQLIQVKFFL